jgi:putative PIN family toxin of toxin-antitoxin system
VRVVLDINIVVSGLLWKAAPRQVLDAAREQHITLYTSSVLLDELAEVLSREHLASVIAANWSSPDFLIQRYAMLAQFVVPASRLALAQAFVSDHVFGSSLVQWRAIW